MFYGNWQFYPSAIVYMMTNDGNFAYSIFAFLITLGTSLASYIVVSKILKNKINWVGSGFNNTVLLHLVWFWNDHGNAIGPNSYLFSLSCALPK